MVALNRSAQGHQPEFFPLPDALALNAGRLADAFGNPLEQQDRAITVVMPPHGSAVLYPETCLSGR